MLKNEAVARKNPLNLREPFIKQTKIFQSNEPTVFRIKSANTSRMGYWNNKNLIRKTVPTETTNKLSVLFSDDMCPGPRFGD